MSLLSTVFEPWQVKSSFGQMAQTEPASSGPPAHGSGQGSGVGCPAEADRSRDERVGTWPQRRRLGLILSLFVAAVAVGAAPAQAQPAPSERVVVRLDTGWRPLSRTFATTRTFLLFSEQGGFKADYAVDGGGIVDGGISFQLWRNLAVGLDVSRYRSVNSALVSSEVPHPFFFDLPRTTTGAVGGLERREVGVHFRALWVSQLADWLVVSVSMGPSALNAKQDLVTEVEHTEGGFPFADVSFTGHRASSQSASTVGVNSAINIDTYLLHKLPFLRNYEKMRHFGVGVLLRYVRGNVTMSLGDHAADVDLGGLQVTFGTRMRF
jgi:hypothetical protein